MAKVRVRATTICNVTIKVVIVTLPETVPTQGSRKVTEKANRQMAMAKSCRKEMLKEKVTGKPE